MYDDLFSPYLLIPLQSSVAEHPAATPVENQAEPDQPAVAAAITNDQEDSLLMFTEEDEDFDPLNRTSSVGQRTGSLSGNLPCPAPKGTSSTTGPTPTVGGANLLGDLSGLDLSADAPSTKPIATTMTTSAPTLQEILQPLQTSTITTSQPLLSSATPLSQPAQIQV